MNDLFVCDSCNHVDTLEFAYEGSVIPTGPLQCTQCQSGQWHDLIHYRPYNPQVDLVVNRPSGVGLD